MKLEPLVYVSNIDKSVLFYTKTLGFKLAEKYPNEDNPTFAAISIGKSRLELVQSRKSNKALTKKGLGGSGVQFYIQTNQVDKLWNQVNNKKIEIVSPIENKDWGDREFSIKDPDGYLISFYTPTTE